MVYCSPETPCISIEEARKLKGLSRSYISKCLGIPYRTLENWEKSSCVPYLERLIVEKILRF